MIYVIGLLSRKKIFYLKPQFGTLLLKNQEILVFKSESVIIMALWKMHLEARTLVLVWMYMAPLIMMIKRVLLRVTPTRRDIKYLQVFPEIDEIIDNSDEERAANSYDQYLGVEVGIPDRKGEKLMGKVRKCVKYDESSASKRNYNPMHKKYLYEVGYHDGMTEQQADNIIAENMMSQVDSEVHHYQVSTEVTDKNKYASAIAKVYGLIKSSSGNLHRKRTTCVWKLLVERKYI